VKLEHNTYKLPVHVKMIYCYMGMLLLLDEVGSFYVVFGVLFGLCLDYIWIIIRIV